MKIMKKIALSLVAVMLICCFTACTSTVSFVVDSESGEKVKIDMDTSKGYQIIEVGEEFHIMDGETLIIKGQAITKEEAEDGMYFSTYDRYTTLIEEGEKNGNAYTFFTSWDDGEWFYAMVIKDSNTGIALESNVSEEAAAECFKMLSFSMV